MVRILNRIRRSLESFFNMKKENTYTHSIVTGAAITSIAVHHYFGEFPKASELSFSVDYLHHSNNNSSLTTDSLFSTATNSLFFEIDILYEILFLVFFLQTAIYLWISISSEVESFMESELDKVQVSPIESDITSPLLDEPKVSLMESNTTSPLDATEVKSSTKSKSTNSNSVSVTQPYDQQCQMIFDISSAPSINPNSQLQMLLQAMMASKMRSNAFNIKSKEEERLTEKKSKRSKKKRTSRKFKRTKHWSIR